MDSCCFSLIIENHFPQIDRVGPFYFYWLLAPTEVTCDFLKPFLFVVAACIWPNRNIIRISMYMFQEATRPPTWPLRGGVKNEK
jgi:hypothetical protein